MAENPYHGGGGFVNNSPYGSQDSPGGSKKKSTNSTIRPVTIRQALDASQVHQDADFTIDGHDVGQLMIIGTVMNVSVTATNVSYTIGDGTGYIDARKWLDSADENGADDSQSQQDKYVCILGSLKTFGNKRHFNAQHVRTITDPNEVAYHMLKAQWVSLSLRNPGGRANGGMNGAAERGAQQSDYSAGVVGGGVSDLYAGLPSMQRQIMTIVRTNTTDEGMHVSEITKVVGGANGEAVMDAVEALMTDGMLFSTIDDLHVKAVE